MIAIDLSKEQALYADPKAIQQINLTEDLDRASGATIFCIIEEAKEKFSIFHKELWKYFECVPQFYFVLI